jgi:hypothetical protein
MKKIRNIIDSELVIRTNDVRLHHEFGEVGTSAKITIQNEVTIFTTDYDVERISYLTVNGITLTPGVHYRQTEKNKISISSYGAPVRKNPTLVTSILVCYHAGESVTSAARTRVPQIGDFVISPKAGQNGAILFDFTIVKNDATNIYWSIIKDGLHTPLFSGSSLQTLNSVATEGGNSTTLRYVLTEAEYLQRIGDKLRFTLIVVYDMTTDGSNLDEKIMLSKEYTVEDKKAIIGTLTATPTSITSTGNPTQNKITLSYNLFVPPANFSRAFTWRIDRKEGSAEATTIVSGDHLSQDKVAIVEDPVSLQTNYGDNKQIRYSLVVVENNTTEALATAITTIAVPVLVKDGKAGYLDASIMSYVDANGVRRKIGSLGTPQDAVEFRNRVPNNIFTKSMPVSNLDGEVFINASVYNPGGTVSYVHFVAVVPNEWGPIKFFQTLGLVDAAAFYSIDLGDGYTAYLYHVAPSSATLPSDYYIKRK